MSIYTACDRGMMALFVVSITATGCGSSSISPSPVPSIPPSSPAPIIAPDPTQFDSTFNAQFVHNALEQSGATVRWAGVLANPNVYLQSAGLSPATIASLEAEARTVVPLFTGGKLSVASFTSTGADLHALVAGAIVVELVSDPNANYCGLTDEAAVAGHVRLNVTPGISDPTRGTNGCFRSLADTFGHELGHALGFYHVAQTDCIMSTARPLSHDGSLCPAERYHAGLAYQTNGAYAKASS